MKKVFSHLLILTVFSIKGFSQNLEEHIFYAPKAENFTSLVFLNSDSKILTNMEDILLLGKENTVLDTFSIESKILKKDQIFAIFVIDESHFNAVCENSSYLISTENKKLSDIKRVNYADRKDYEDFSHLYLTLDAEIALQYQNKRNSNTIFFNIYDNSRNKRASAELNYKGNFNQFTSILYSFPEQYFFNKNFLIYPNSFDNTLYFINLKNGNLKKLDLLPFDLKNGSQTVFFDRSNKEFFMLRDTGIQDSSSHKYTLYSLNTKKNEYNKLKEFSYTPSTFRGGIYDGKFIMTGRFNNESAWFTIPISDIDRYSNNLRLQINE